MDYHIVFLLCFAFLPVSLCIPLVRIARSEDAMDNDTPEEVDLSVVTNDPAEYYRIGSHGDVKKLPELKIEMDSDGVQYVSMVKAELYWKDGVVPYSFYADPVDSSTNETIQKAMQHIMDTSCIRFVYCPGCYDKVVIQTHDVGCYSSYLGRQGGTQILNFGAGCLSRSTILHELLHVIGFYHEHNRPDRDQFVIIDWNNINGDWKQQFDVYNLSSYGKFDYTSIMMYPGDNLAISVDGRRYMRPVPKIGTGKYDQVNRVMGHVVDLSQGDIKKLNAAYCNTTATTAQPNYNTTTTTGPGGVNWAIGPLE